MAAMRAEKAKSIGKNKTVPAPAIKRMMQSFQPPTHAEGFDTLVEVDNRDLFRFLLLQSDK